jgi:bifunctional non-homologous end joining protein LigD
MPRISKRYPHAPLPRWISPQLTQLAEAAPSGPQWLHEIKLDGFRMAARIDRGQATLLTRTGLDWSAKYPVLQIPLGAVRAKTAYLDGKLCGVGSDGLPSFAETQAATDGDRGARVVFYAFDLPIGPKNSWARSTGFSRKTTHIHYNKSNFHNGASSLLCDRHPR